jgi:hypothetical protein
MIKEAGTMILIILGTFVLAFILQRIVSGPLGRALFFPAWSPGLLLVSLKLRNGFRKWVFEVDREVANKLGPEGILEVLDRMKFLDPKANPSTRLARFLAFWSPSINDRVSELRNPQTITLPKRSRIPRIGLRWCGIIIGIGAAIYWSSGFVAGLVYSQGRTSFACTSNGCAAPVMSAAVGYWLAILAGISLVIGVFQRIRRTRRKKNTV